MDVEGLAKQLILQNMTPEQQKAVLESIRQSLQKTRELKKQKVGENAQLVVQALKKIEADIRAKYDDLGNKIEQRVVSIKDGKDGKDGKNGANGRDGRDGMPGPIGPKGKDGLNGRDGKDGEDGVSVTDAHIDFDGSLIISLSSGRTINVGEVVAPDLTEKIKIIANGGGTSQTVIDSLASLQAQITALQNLGAVNYVGTWNATTNSPAITGGTGDKGDYYVVNVAGNTTIDGQSNWGVGDWIIFNGTAWQKVDGGDTGNLTDLNVSGTTTLSALTASQAVFTNASKQLVSNAVTGTGNVVMSTSPVLTTPNLGTPSAATLTNATGLPISTGVSGLGTGVATALAVNTGSNGSFVVNGGALGTPSSGTVTNLTGTASININGTVGATTANTGNFTSVTSTSEVVTGASGILTRQAATQDGVQIIGRAGGTSSWEVILTPTTLTADRTLTLPNVTGTVVTTGDTGSITSTMIADGTIVNGDINASAAIAVSKLAASTISGVTLGNNLGTLTMNTSGTGLSGSTTYNGSGAATFTVTSNATSANTASTIVARDATGTASVNINGTVGATTPSTGAFTSITSTSASGILTRAAATQDGVQLLGRAGGTSSWEVTLTPNTLTADRTLTLPDNSGTVLTTGATVTVAQGGTGATSLTANNVLLGNGTSAVQVVAPGTAGNVLTSNGTTWISSTPTSGGTVTSVAQTFTGGLISVAGSPVTTSGTLALTVAGTSGGVPYFSSASTWASSGVLTANAIVVGGGAGAAPSSITTGTGVVTALGVNTGSAGAFIVNGGALGTPSSGTVTNLTGTASININGTVGATTANSGAFTTLSATGVTTVQAGTAAAPAITTSGDTNTGIFFPAADAVAISTGGTERLSADSSGNLQFKTANTKLLNSSGRTMLNQTGAILQVVQNTTVGSSSTTSTTAVDVTNFTVTITPSSTSSKILIIASGRLVNTIVAATNIIYYQTLVRTSTTLVQRYLAAESGAGGLQAKGSLAISYLDSPATTSATTYKIQHYTSSASSSSTCDEGWIIAMEISG